MLAGYVHSIARADHLLLVANRHDSSTGDYVINLFNLSMMMRSDCVAGRENLFGDATLSYRRRGAIYQWSNLGAVSGVDDLRAFAVYDDHESSVVRSSQ